MDTVRAFSQGDPSLLASAGIHHDVQQFLFREALLLDHGRYDEWTELLDRDIRYRTPARFARAIGIEPPVDALYFEDNYQSLTVRIRQLRNSEFVACAGNSMANTHVRRLITNVIVSPHNCGEYDVLSYLLIARCDPDNNSYLLTAERYDHLRRAARSFKICRRQIEIDKRAVAAATVDIFL